MKIPNRQDAKSVCIKRRRGAMSAGEVLEELRLNAVTLLCVVTGEEENKEEESDLLVAAALSKIDAGVALLVREVGVLFILGKAGCVSAVFASRVLSRFRNRIRPLIK